MARCVVAAHRVCAWVGGRYACASLCDGSAQGVCVGGGRYACASLSGGSAGGWEVCVRLAV